MQTTNTLVMVRPTRFAFNEETAEDNEFQNKLELSSTEVQAQAMKEFEQATASLQKAGVDVLVLEENPDLGNLPDAVFPNNWFSTDGNGTLYIYPMAAPSRAKEVRIDELKQLLISSGFNIQKVVDFRSIAEDNRLADAAKVALEGTGSFVFDHQHKKAYLAISARSDVELAQQACEVMDYELVAFTSLSETGTPFYHTNVVMSIGTKWAAVCIESIKDPEERAKVSESLSNDDIEVIDVSLEQTQESFCCNILEVHNEDMQSFSVMSQQAFDGFDDDQKESLAKSSTILPIAIPTIEKIGGGSMRCMMAEVFLPYSN